MEKSLLARDLGWPEGPVVLPDKRVCFVETFKSQISVWGRSLGVRQYAYTAGGPNSCVLGGAGELYVCQNGGDGWGMAYGRNGRTTYSARSAGRAHGLRSW